jgi:hypothetical protein
MRRLSKPKAIPVTIFQRGDQHAAADIFGVRLDLRAGVRERSQSSADVTDVPIEIGPLIPCLKPLGSKPIS